MGGRVEHVGLRVEDIDAARSFYIDTMGLVECERTDSRSYFDCGLGGSFDLAVVEGGTGLDHFAVRVAPDEFDVAEARLDALDSPTRRTDDAEPGQNRGLRFSLPSGVDMELVTTDRGRYPHTVDTAHRDRGATAPIGLNHVNLASDAVEADAEFVEANLGFEISEVELLDDESWLIAFTRYGESHHDVAFTRSDEPDNTLKHVAWTVTNLDHLKQFVDEIARHGFELEVGISRHRAGNNLFAYFWEPGGNRFEVTTEMATVESGTPTLVRGSDDPPSFTAWGGIPSPETLRDGT